MPLPMLPTELWEDIFELAELEEPRLRGQRILLRCALVCKAWNPVALRVFWRHLFINDYFQTQRLSRYLATNASRGHYPCLQSRSLEIHATRDIHEYLHRDLLNTLYPYLGSLRSFKLCYAESNWDLDALAEACGCTLEYFSASAEPDNDFLRMLNRLQILRSLSISVSVSFGSWAVPDSHLSLPQLRHVAITLATRKLDVFQCFDFPLLEECQLQMLFSDAVVNVSVFDLFLSRHAQTMTNLTLRIGPQQRGDNHRIIMDLPNLRIMTKLRVLHTQGILTPGELAFLPPSVEELALDLHSRGSAAQQDATFEFLDALLDGLPVATKVVRPCPWWIRDSLDWHSYDKNRAEESFAIGMCQRAERGLHRGIHVIDRNGLSYGSYACRKSASH
ncbi:hypothetical protein CALVIDRAFT_556289 [Calocera viscosa TUFC12733]|uniref:F-box domain-containing protein n=1 Tax=Calocera viscosa (strain TUFC12733) TaxID=1330018 RepID=A0A167KC30_CALVF|nr:hypothetical protein CALVIDRAFT_556289 [Calocera viscosa TUFC12733]